MWAADLSYATRLVARSPSFTIACVVALGLAIGANVTVFTLATPSSHRGAFATIGPRPVQMHARST